MAVKNNSKELPSNPNDSYERLFKRAINGNLSMMEEKTTNIKNQKMFTKISLLIVSMKFLWFLGHVIVVYNTIINSTLAKVNLSYQNSYHKALLGAMISNLVLLYKTHGLPDFASSWFENICKDENFHYLLIATIFNFTKPLFFLLYPFCFYSIFHILNFVYSEILSKKPESKSTIQVINFLKTYQNLAIEKIAQFEIMIVFPMMFIAALCRQVSLLAFIVYGRFLYMRYYISPVARKVWKDIKMTFDDKLEQDNIPIYVKYVYYGILTFVNDFFLNASLLDDEEKKVKVVVTPVDKNTEE